MDHKREHRYQTFDVEHTKIVKEARKKEKRMIKINQPRRNK